MTAESLKELLAALHFTAPMSESTRVRLAQAAEWRVCAAGELIFREGTRQDRTYVVAAGLVALDMQVLGRGPVRILTLGPGDLLAWSGLIGDEPLTASATAVEPTRLIALPARRLLEWAEQDHEFGYQWMKALAGSLAKRLTATRLQLLDLFVDRPVPSPLVRRSS